MEIRDLDKQISSGTLGNLYFFYGSEQFLMENKLRSVKNALIAPDFEDFNYILLDGKKVSFSDIEREVMAVPVMAEKKMVVIRDSGLFNNSKTRDFSLLCDLLSNLPEYICLVFCETSFDKKKENNLDVFKKNGDIIFFDTTPLSQLEIWLEKLFEKKGKSILHSDISSIIRLAGQNMSNLFNEYQKLISFVGDRKKITADDISLVVSKSTETRIFDVIDRIAEGKSKGVFDELEALKAVGENPSTVLSLISSRLGELLMVKQLSAEKLSIDRIASYFEPRRPTFVVKKLLAQSKNFSEDYLSKMALLGPEYTAKVRSGLLSPHLALEMYAAKLLK